MRTRSPIKTVPAEDVESTTRGRTLTVASALAAAKVTSPANSTRYVTVRRKRGSQLAPPSASVVRVRAQVNSLSSAYLRATCNVAPGTLMCATIFEERSLRTGLGVAVSVSPGSLVPATEAPAMDGPMPAAPVTTSSRARTRIKDALFSSACTEPPGESVDLGEVYGTAVSAGQPGPAPSVPELSLIHISEPTR